jgi:hypothetical protein
MKAITTLALAAALLTPGMAQAKSAEEAAPKKPLIQIALLLDTSNSMDGLIAQAKTQLWKIVNEFIAAKRDGVAPELQVALYEYGNDGIPRGEGHIRMVVPLSTDLDKVSEELFALKTNGGHEFCGAVIQAAVDGLGWSKDANDLKAIFIAGNEPFTQGQVHYSNACKGAIAKGIVVNTIHCGPYAKGVEGKWKEGALLADGSYMHIDQDRTIHHVSAPQDKKIAELGAALNRTYLAYGAKGQAGVANQTAQDANAAAMSLGSIVQRSVTKSSKYYTNDAWDLVDAVRQGKVKLDEVKEEQLPEELRKMTVAERRKAIEAKAAERTRIQKEIQELNEARKKHVAAELKKQAAAAGAESLDSAMIKSLRKQAEAKKFDLK